MNYTNFIYIIILLENTCWVMDKEFSQKERNNSKEF